MGTALAGGARSIYTALTLPPAVAMSPPLPTHYAYLGIEKLQFIRHFSQLTIMAVRHIIRWPVRSSLTVLGIAMSGALLITAMCHNRAGGRAGRRRLRRSRVLSDRGFGW